MRTSIISSTPMGKQCFNPKLHATRSAGLDQCAEPYYFSDTGQRTVYSKLVTEVRLILIEILRISGR